MRNMYSLACLQCVMTDRMSTGSWPCQLVLRFNLIVQMFLKKILFFGFALCTAEVE